MGATPGSGAPAGSVGFDCDCIPAACVTIGICTVIGLRRAVGGTAGMGATSGRRRPFDFSRLAADGGGIIGICRVVVLGIAIGATPGSGRFNDVSLGRLGASVAGTSEIALVRAFMIGELFASKLSGTAIASTAAWGARARPLAEPSKSMLTSTSGSSSSTSHGSGLSPNCCFM